MLPSRDEQYPYALGETFRVDAQLASVDAAAQPPGARTWRELTTANARRLFPRLASRD